MAVDAGRRFRFRRPVGLRPVMLRAGLALAILALVLVAMKAKAGAIEIDIDRDEAATAVSGHR